MTPVAASWVGGLDARQRAMLVELGLDASDLPPPVAAPSAPKAAAVATAVRTNLAATGAAKAGVAQAPAAPHSRDASLSGPAAPVHAVTQRTNADAVAQMDWAALKAEVAQCRACGLCEGRTQSVFGVGAARPDVLVVGGAPEADDDRLGEPAMGSAGALLDAMLGAVGMSRWADASTLAGTQALGEPTPIRPAVKGSTPRTTYITNAVKCRSPQRNASATEVAQCAPLLRRQIDLLQPKLIVACGRLAVASLLQSSEPLGKLRGRVHHVGSTPLIASYDAPYLLRADPAEKTKAWDDWCLLIDTWARL
jgi:uracil-DNA glycosylase